jgi:serine/threonine protein kinase
LRKEIEELRQQAASSVAKTAGKNDEPEPEDMDAAYPLRIFHSSEVVSGNKALGQGAVGAVTLASVQINGRKVGVAVKQFAVADADAFELERDCIRRLQHPNIVELVGTMMTDVGPCLLLELLEQPNWQQLNIENALRDMLAAIEHFHSLNLVHLDIKLDNVMMDPSTHKMKLIDFSVGNVANKPCHGVYGSLPFMAPELLREAPYQGTAADMYSIGIMLVFMLDVQSLFEILGFTVGLNDTIEDPAARQAAYPQVQQAVVNLGEAFKTKVTATTYGKPSCLYDLCVQMIALAPNLRPTATEALRQLPRYK